MKFDISPLKQWLSSHKDLLVNLILSLFLAVAACLGLTALNSCGSTVKALVQSPKDSATTTITITTNNPTQVSPDTNVPINIPLK